ncbi:MAG: 5-formyltetrahydrofolate cyclo-ligase [Polymorphobacter sp.]
MMVPPTLSQRVEWPLPATDPKPALRRIFRQRRQEFATGLDAEKREQLESALARVVTPAAICARILASYAARGGEIDPRFVGMNLPSLAYPRVAGERLSFHICGWQDLRPGFGKIPEPSASAPQVVPDVVLVPLLAVTPDGRRLGQGGGFYDRALADLRSRQPIIAIGMAWDVQMTDSLPHEPWDALLDHIATPTRLVDCARHR